MDPGELQAYFGKQIQADLTKALRSLFKRTGWSRVDILQLITDHEGGGLPEMLHWFTQLFNTLAGPQGESHQEIPLSRQLLLDPIILPSGQVLYPDDAWESFNEVTKKLSHGFQYNTGQLQPLPGKLTLRNNRLVFIRGSRQTEITQPGQLEEEIRVYFQPDRVPALLKLSAEELIRRIICVDEVALYEAVMNTAAEPLRQKLSQARYPIVIVHNIQPLGLLGTIRSRLPESILLWHNHLSTADPTPLVWNFFAPQISQGDGVLYQVPEFYPKDQPDLIPVMTTPIIYSPAIYPFSPKNRTLDRLGPQVVGRVLAQYQRDYILVYKFELKKRLERAYLKVTGKRATDAQIEEMLDSLTKASIRASFMEEGRRPEVERFISRAADTQDGMLELVRQLHGIDPQRPLFTQISRYDPLKDPVGAIAAFVRAYLGLVRDGVPLDQRPQFVYAGALEEDDPNNFEELVKVFQYLDRLRSEITEELHDLTALEVEELEPLLRRDIFILILSRNDALANAIEVNALQRTSRAVLQKSLREGFSLALTESMWKGLPVIGGNCGGIRLQIDHGVTGFLVGRMVDGELVDSVEDAAQYLITYSKHPDMAQRMGEMSRRKVAQEFLLPVNLIQLLHKIGELVANKAAETRKRNAKATAAGPASGQAPDPEERSPDTPPEA